MPLNLKQFTAAFLVNLRSTEFSSYLLLAGLLRGAHTEVLALWQGLSAAIDPSPDAQNFNGLINFCMALCACCMLAGLARWDGLARRQGHVLATVTFVTVPALLVSASFAHTLPVLALCLSLYYGVAELFFAVAASRAAAAIVTPLEDPSYTAQYVASVAARYALGLLAECVIQLFVFQRWGHVGNVLGLRLSLPVQLRVIALSMIVFLPLAVRVTHRAGTIGRPRREEMSVSS